MVAAEVADLALHAALLVPGRGRAELRLEPPVRAERDEPYRLLAAMAAQDLADRTGQVVVAQNPDDPAKVGEGVLVGLEERLLRGTRVGPVERRPTRHAAHAEHLQRDPVAAELGGRLVPVDLSLRAPSVGLRHEGRASIPAEHPSPLADMVADRRFRDRTSRHLGQDPLVNPPCRVTLLARSRRIRLENGIDERHHRFQGRLGARAIATQRRQGALHRLAHHPAMNAERPRHTLHRADPELVLAAQPLEQFHLRSPVQTTPRTSTAGRRTLGHTRRGGPTFASTGGHHSIAKPSPTASAPTSRPGARPEPRSRPWSRSRGTAGRSRTRSRPPRASSASITTRPAAGAAGTATSRSSCWPSPCWRSSAGTRTRQHPQKSRSGSPGRGGPRPLVGPGT